MEFGKVWPVLAVANSRGTCEDLERRENVNDFLKVLEVSITQYMHRTVGVH